MNSRAKFSEARIREDLYKGLRDYRCDTVKGDASNFTDYVGSTDNAEVFI